MIRPTTFGKGFEEKPIPAHARRKADDVLKQIHEEKTRKGTIVPSKYDAWSHGDTPGCHKWKMRGIRSCQGCSGNGYVWVTLGEDAWGWIRCGACHSRMATAGETKR